MFVFRTKVPYGSYGQHPLAGNILRLECEGAVRPVTITLPSSERCCLLPLTNAPFLIVSISGRQITVVLSKLEELCQISPAEDLGAFLSIFVERRHLYALSVMWEVLLEPAFSGAMSNLQNVRFISECDGVIWFPAVKMRGLISII